MDTHIVTKEQIKHSLDTWYQSMLKHDFIQSKSLKEEIDSQVSAIEVNKHTLLYYSLMNFRYQVLTDSLSVTKESFDTIDSLYDPNNNVLTYYYHLFKGIYETLMTNYQVANGEFEQAKSLLKNISDPLEHAEFHYRFAYLSYQSYQTLLAIDQVRLAKAEYERHSNYEICIALCENIFAMSCIDLRQFEQAEESFTKALDVFKKAGIERFTLMIRNNLGLLYANQNLSESALRHLSEVTKKSPNHFRAIYLEADEYLKLHQYNEAEALIEKGLHICNQLKNHEYQYRFMILKEMNTNTELLEKAILTGISYFEREELFDCIEEYAGRLADKFYNESNHEKASKYYHMSKEAKQKQLVKGALK
ncbi:response regulator aspartate phosphatase [Bacillus sp. C1]